MEDILLTTGRAHVSPFPPTSKLPLVQPAPISAQTVPAQPKADTTTPVVVKPPIPTKVPEPASPQVFNRSGQIQGFDIPGYDYIEIKPGHWTQETAAKKPIPRSFALQYLRNNDNFNVQVPHEGWFASDDKHLTVAACVDSVTGWGVCNSRIIEQLAILRGESVEKGDSWSANSVEPLSKCDLLAYPTTYWQTQDVPEITQRLMRRAYHPTKWGLAMTIPTEIGYIPVRNLILMSMWEVQELPDGWGELMKKYVKHLIVPAQSQVEVFRQGYDGDISVVPLGVDTDTFAFKERPPRGEDEPFTILLYGSPLSSRKSPIETITEVCYLAFGDAFGDPIDDWKIILKTRNNIVGAGKFKVEFNDPHIEVKNGYMTPQELAELCYTADIGIVLSKFEGYGLPFREMMSTGLPVIVSANTGHLDDCDPMLNIPIPTKRIIPAEEAYSGNEEWKWHEPDFEEAARELRYSYNLWKLGGKRQSEMGRRASQFIQDKRTWRHTAEKINEIVSKVIANNGN